MLGWMCVIDKFYVIVCGAASFRFVNGRCQHCPFVSLCVPHINYTSSINIVFNGKLSIRRISSVV